MEIASRVGAPRIVPTRGIPYPTGDPSLDQEGERRWRGLLLGAALRALCAEVEGPEIFPAEHTEAEALSQ